jgi:uncharacterized protein YbgA (DUF1722 family)
MVLTDLIGGTGNNLFQYAIARIIADRKDYNLYVNNLHHLQQYFQSATNIENRKNISDRVLDLGYNSIPQNIQHIDLDRVEQHQGMIHLKGFFQKYVFYENHVDLLKEIFYYDDAHIFKPLADDIVIHIRLGDYKAMNWFIHPNIYVNILEKLNLTYNRCYIVTDEPSSNLLDSFKSLKNVILLSNTPLIDFTILKYAKRLIISQSTFSWWAAFIGNSEEVYVPISAESRYPWKINPGVDDIDLIPENNKFIKINF